jgi:hypothetical protein
MKAWDLFRAFFLSNHQKKFASIQGLINFATLIKFFQVKLVVGRFIHQHLTD